MKNNKPTIRDEVTSLWNIADLARQMLLGGIKIDKVKLNSLRGVKALLEYGCYYGRSGRRKIPVDVLEMVKLWTNWISTFATAHDKRDVDKVEFEIDEILSPILTAPVKQLRAFYSGLCESLEKDRRIPFFVWQMFSAYGKVVIDSAMDDETIILLKKKLASEIADLVEQEDAIRIDLHKALVGALMWRSKEDLNEVKADLEAGAKPRIKGRQSCLFLTTRRRGRGQKEHAVML